MPTPSFVIQRTARRLCTNLHNLHLSGVIHGDVKPRNVVRLGGDLKLIDFDMAICGEAPGQGHPAGVKRTLSTTDMSLVAAGFAPGGSAHSRSNGRPEHRAAAVPEGADRTEALHELAQLTPERRHPRRRQAQKCCAVGGRPEIDRFRHGHLRRGPGPRPPSRRKAYVVDDGYVARGCRVRARGFSTFAI